MNRHTGKVLWIFDSNLAFRHNAIAIGAGKLFCIDRLLDPVVERMNRRGETPAGTPKLICLDVRTGKVVWQTTQAVFGTWLGYSEEHDALLQAGRPSRDMLPDEPGDRLIFYRRENGKVLWDRPHNYDGPCMLHGDTIITQSNAFNLLTGEQVVRNNPLTGMEILWQFSPNCGCNTAVASQHLITFRSAAAGYFDLANDGGTGNLGAPGLTSVTLTLDKKAEEARLYTVALYFIEPDAVKPGDRVFDVALQGQQVLKNFDIVREAGRSNQMVVKEFKEVAVRGDLAVALRPSASAKTSTTVLCGIAVTNEAQ